MKEAQDAEERKQREAEGKAEGLDEEDEDLDEEPGEKPETGEVSIISEL